MKEQQIRCQSYLHESEIKVDYLKKFTPFANNEFCNVFANNENAPTCLLVAKLAAARTAPNMGVAKVTTLTESKRSTMLTVAEISTSTRKSKAGNST